MKGYGASDGSQYVSTIERIDKKIEDHYNFLSKPDTFSGQKVLSRHEMDLERSLVKDNSISKSLSTVLTKSSEFKRSIHPDDPLNHIPDILKTIIPNKDGKRTARKRRRIAKQETKNDGGDEGMDTHEESITGDEMAGCAAKPEGWSCNVEKVPTKMKRTDEYVFLGHSSGPNTGETNRRLLYGSIEQISKETILRNRKTKDEIKQIPRFENYDPGPINKV